MPAWAPLWAPSWSRCAAVVVACAAASVSVVAAAVAVVVAVVSAAVAHPGATGSSVPCGTWRGGPTTQIWEVGVRPLSCGAACGATKSQRFQAPGDLERSRSGCVGLGGVLEFQPKHRFFEATPGPSGLC